MENDDLLQAAKAVLEKNDKGNHIIPAEGLYPHQWLWDSCFIAIGLSNYDTKRAQKEIISLLKGQWSNGMMPHVLFTGETMLRYDNKMWRSQVSPLAPDHMTTSGITQPPMLAEAVVQIGKKLSVIERRTWYQRVFRNLVAYHQWLYAERDPHNEGLVLQIHPWETGLDNTPPWVDELHQHLLPFWVRVVRALKLDTFLTRFRRDARFVPASQRLSTIDSLALYSIQRRLRRKGYDIHRVLTHSLFAIEDLSYNAIFIRANKQLRHIAKTIGKDLPDTLTASMKQTETALEQLWDAHSTQYYSRNFITHKLLKVPSIATLLPLYGGSVSKERAAELVKLLKDRHQFGATFPVPSVPLNSEWFSPHRYWQGPVWINMNWLIIDGLKRYGFTQEAEHITKQTIELFKKHGAYEYFSPIDGSPAGAKNFSWTAALIIDLLSN